MSGADGRRLVVTHLSRRSGRKGAWARGRFTDDDVEVVGGEGEPFPIPAHSRFLACVSARFKQLLEGLEVQGRRGRLVVEGVTSLALLDVIAFIYTGRVQFRRRRDCRAFMDTLDRLEVNMPSTTVCEEEDKEMEVKVINNNFNNLSETRKIDKKIVKERSKYRSSAQYIADYQRSLTNSGLGNYNVRESLRVRGVEAVYMKRKVRKESGKERPSKGSGNFEVSNLARMENESGTTIDLFRTGNGKSNGNVLEIVGKAEQVARAKEMVTDLCNNTLSIPLDVKQKFQVIGSNGSKIKELQSLTGAAMWVAGMNKGGLVQAGVGLELLVTGSREQVERARCAVVTILK